MGVLRRRPLWRDWGASVYYLGGEWRWWVRLGRYKESMPLRRMVVLVWPRLLVIMTPEAFAATYEVVEE